LSPSTIRPEAANNMREWCLNDQTSSVCLVTGAGGVGKTRLALRLEKEIADLGGWLCLWIRAGKEAAAVKAVRGVRRGRHSGVLLIVDYVEIRSGLDEMLRSAAADAGPALRMLLLTRQAGDWWQRLEDDREIGALATNPKRILLIDLDLSPRIDAAASDIDLVRQAIPFFASRLKIPFPDPSRVNLTGHHPPARVLDLHAAALVAVLAAKQQPADTALSVDIDYALRDVLGHERRYWRRRAEALELFQGPQGLSMKKLAQVIAAACLIGASDQDDLRNLLGRVPGVDSSVMTKLGTWLSELYPPGRGEGYVGSLRPDRLAEMHVTQELDESPGLAHACLTNLNERQARQALILLARASAEYPAARRFFEEALFKFNDVIPAIEAPQDTMIAIANAIPFPITLSLQLFRLERSEEALTAVSEAIGTYRKLSASSRYTFQPDIATALQLRAEVLKALGREAEANLVLAEAAEIPDIPEPPG